jgi:hypothetical protein
MSVVISAPKMPTSRSTTNDQESYEFDHSKIKLDSESNKGNVRNLTYLYNSGVGYNVPVEIFHTTAVRPAAVRTDIGFGGQYVETDSVTGRSRAIGKRSWGLWTIQPAGLLDLTSDLLACDLESLVSLWRTAVTAGVANATVIQKVMDAGRIW